MKRLLPLLTLLLISLCGAAPAAAQSGYTTVTATVTDSAGNIYSNAPYTVSFYDPGTSGKLPLLNGSVFQTVYVGFATDGNGNLSLTLPDNNVIASSSLATNTQWRFNVCDHTGVTCFQTLITITGASQNVSAALKAASAPITSTLPGLNSVNNWLNFNGFSGSSSFGGPVTFGSPINPAQITTNVNDYSGCKTGAGILNSYCRVSTDASRNMTGIDGSFLNQLLLLVNIGSFNLVLKNLDGGSSAANQFSLGSDITLQPNHAISLLYDVLSSKWRSLNDTTGIVTIVTKSGSGSGVGYSRSAASFADIDATNLTSTLTVPIGWKATITFSGESNANNCSGCYIQIADSGVLVGHPVRISLSNSYTTISYLMAVFTGDGGSHTFRPQFEGDGANAMVFTNLPSSTPTMFIRMEPAN